MSIVTGEVAAMLNVLGLRKGDNRILDVIVLLGPEMEVEDFDWGDVQSTYYLFRRAGTELLFEDEVLVSAIVRTLPDSADETYRPYPRPGALLEGLSPNATRSEVTALLGQPERAGPNFDRYEVNNRYLHFEFDPAGRVAKLSALLEPV
ncbi:hypothetical protein [Nocardia sp. CS682]|uniref:hypothetical protein n=1 Tax=Nocardia sp. CS682 TaxID=1047172 RepID=UPI001074A7A2|nr:hypothetical protein [Nocardia sp. CS682]QBS39456.1 hypothetical protein DMB37_04255 [Nocardia sp. CS682]